MVGSSDLFKPIVDGEIPQAIVGQVKALIRRGILEPGDQLPGERQLMQQLNVSRSSLREALQALEATGFVRTIAGKGTYIGNPSEHADNILESMMWRWKDQGAKALQELFEVRSQLEVEAAALAAEGATPEALHLISSELDRLTSAFEARDIEGMAAADVAFHRAIFLATGNSLLVLLIDSIAIPLHDSRVFAFRLSGGHPNTVRNHRIILDAIEAGDADNARTVMTQHLAKSRRSLDIYMAASALEPSPDSDGGLAVQAK